MPDKQAITVHGVRHKMSDYLTQFDALVCELDLV